MLTATQAYTLTAALFVLAAAEWAYIVRAMLRDARRSR